MYMYQTLIMFNMTANSLSLTYFIFIYSSQGREEGAVIEDWEDPDLSVYRSTDRYGFMQYVFNTLKIIIWMYMYNYVLTYVHVCICMYVL